MKTFKYSWTNELENLRVQLEQMLGMKTAQINREYLIKMSGDGYNQLLGVGGLLEMVGLQKAAKFIQRANACAGDVCKCKVYGGVQISFYIH